MITRFERVQLYTDWVPARAYMTDPGDRAAGMRGLPMGSLRTKLSSGNQLPLYAILWPTANGKVKVLGVYDEGKINQPDRFANWLKEGLEKAKK